jgi:hypothetical protein
MSAQKSYNSIWICLTAVLAGIAMLLPDLQPAPVSNPSPWHRHASPVGLNALLPHAQADLASLPRQAQPEISAALGRDMTEYHVRPGLAGFVAENARQELTADITRTGIEIRNHELRWGMTLRSYGYGRHQAAVEAAAPIAIRNRAEFRRGPLTEWYVNGPMGIEQGFTLLRPPSISRSRVGAHEKRIGIANSLTITLFLTGTSIPTIDKDRKELTLHSPDGRPVLRYAGLSAVDARGRSLPASLEMQGEDLLLHVSDRGARYPVMIDPIVQTAILTPSDGQADENFTVSLAIDGNTAVVGASVASTGSGTRGGAAYVFVKPSTGWVNTTQTAKLTGSDSTATNSYFGYSVAISGNTIVVGRFSGSENVPVYVFVKPASGWTDMTETTQLLAPAGSNVLQGFGAAVSVSGSTIVAGAPYFDGVYPGTAYVYVESGGGWKTTSVPAATLQPSDPVGSNYFGGSLSLDNNTLAVGATGAYTGNGPTGAVYVFVRPAGGWANTTQTAKLSPSDGQPGGVFGVVFLRGKNLAVGAPYVNDYAGTAYVFVEPAGGWTNMTQTAELSPSNPHANNYFGMGVAVSGNVAVVGARGDNNYRGSAYLYVEPPTGWVNSKETRKLTASDQRPDNLFGSSVAMSGQTILVGAPTAPKHGETSGPGEAYIFGTE